MLNEMVAGSVIELDTPIGTTVPMRFGTDGLVAGEAGILAAVLGAAKDRGRWWIENDQLCIKWFRWFDAEPRCMEIRNDGNRIFWRKTDGDTGTGTVTVRAKPTDAAPKVQVAAAETKPDKAGKAEKSQKSEPKAVQAAAATTEGPAPVETASIEKPAATPDTTPPAAAAPAVVPSTILNAASPEAAGPSAAPATSERHGLAFAGASALGISPAAAATITPASPEVVAPAVTAESPPPTPAGGSAPPPAPAEPQTSDGKRKLAALSPQDQKPAKAAEKKATTPARSATAAAKKPAETFRVARVADNDLLHVRNGPSEYHKPVGIIPPMGRGVQITGTCANVWCPVRYGKLSGWVNRYYLAVE